MRFKLCLMIMSMFVTWFGTVVSQEEEPSDRLLSHALMLNGFFIRGNPKDSQSPSAIEDLRVFTLRPVDIPALKKGITYYIEFLIGGRVVVQEVLRLTETEEGLTMTEGFQFSDPSKFPPGTFDIANLTALQESDIGELKCAITFKETNRGNFKALSKSPGCTGYQEFRGLWTCRGLTTIYLTQDLRVKWLKYRDRYPLSPYLKEKTKNFNFRCGN